MQRPDWLVSRLRTISMDEHGPRFTVLRQPKGPDGTKGFKKSNQRSTSFAAAAAAAGNETTNGHGDTSGDHS